MESSGMVNLYPYINIYYFLLFLLRPQQKKLKEHKAMVEV